MAERRSEANVISEWRALCCMSSVADQDVIASGRLHAACSVNTHAACSTNLCLSDIGATVIPLSVMPAMNGSPRILAILSAHSAASRRRFLHSLVRARCVVLEYPPCQGIAGDRDHLLDRVKFVRHGSNQRRPAFPRTFVPMRDCNARVHEGIVVTGAGNDDIAVIILVHGQRDSALLGHPERIPYQGAELGIVPEFVYPPYDFMPWHLPLRYPSAPRQTLLPRTRRAWRRRVPEPQSQPSAWQTCPPRDP